MLHARIRSVLFATAAAITVSACGADEVTQPDIIVMPGTPTPTPTPTPPTPTPTPPTSLTAAPASACTAGSVDNGIITLDGTLGTVRDCRLNTRVYTSNITLSARRDSGVVYTIPTRTEIGTDAGFNGTGGTSAVMTIRPGVTVVATDLSSFLAVNRGSRLEAVGTSDDPIIFTHIDQLTGDVVDTSDRLWGGIQLLGTAPVSDCVSPTSLANGNCERAVEGPVGQPIFYGGNNPNNDAGTLRYMQILFTGVGAGGNELQGLTTGGVGSATEIDFLQIHNSADDGIESFGGRQDMSHLIFTGVADDSIDLDSGYQGAIQYALAVRRLGTTTGAGDGTVVELDSGASSNNAANQAPRTTVFLANFTFINPENNAPALKFRGGADISVINGIVTSAASTAGAAGCLDVDDSFTVQAAASTTPVDAPSGPAAADRGPPQFQSVVFDCDTLFDPDSDSFEDQSLNAMGNANNNPSFTNTLTMIFINGANETMATATGNLSQTFDLFLESPGYIGAVRDANDDWFENWTCDADVADLNGLTSCNTFRIV